ncbi:MAG: hypothetical protein TREMPRED_000225 [Tremellales sp. Tagirdzhanova-0007]|nr:MAG: hypothetical protein TREMPRED_000225 [Tremellales sp. Tagirdzhanova-0007]
MIFVDKNILDNRKGERAGRLDDRLRISLPDAVQVRKDLSEFGAVYTTFAYIEKYPERILLAMSGSSTAKPKVNLRSTAVKRIMQEASEPAHPEEDDFIAAPLETDIFEWHCTMRGVAGSEYEGGLYHLRILLPPSYPMSAPDIILLTPNGRFELGKKICIDGLTSFHAGSWQPAWGVRTAITGLRSFWMQSGEALSAIAALDYSKEERKRLATLYVIACVSGLEMPNTSGASPVLVHDAGSGDSGNLDLEETRPVPSAEPQSDETTSPEEPTSARVMSSSASEARLAEDPTNPSLSSRPIPNHVPQPAARSPRRFLEVFRSIHWLASRRPNDPPLWIDLCIAFLVSVLSILIYKRIA